jgi:glycosyltransferase involved in cell wall biosynthesis
MSTPRRVLFLVPSIRRGGMERLVSILLRGLDRSRFSPELVVLHRRGEDAAVRAKIPDDVPLTSFGKRSRLDAAWLVPRLGVHLAQTRPAVAIGFMTYQNLLLLAAGLARPRRLPVIATEHVTPDALRATRGKRAQLAIAARLYPHAAAVVAVSEGLRGALIDDVGLPADRVLTVYNPFDPEIDASLATDQPADDWLNAQEPTLVAVGRLVKQKAYPVLLEALALVRRETPARLLILGEGEERPALEARARSLEIAEAVRLLGYQPNPFPYMQQASAYVMSSDWEAFPFALVEAARVGAAIVSTDCEFGPNEIIESERSGLLVPPGDPPALAAAILRVLREPALAERLRAGARGRSEAFSPEEAVRRYSALIDQAAAGADE